MVWWCGGWVPGFIDGKPRITAMMMSHGRTEVGTHGPAELTSSGIVRPRY